MLHERDTRNADTDYTTASFGTHTHTHTSLSMFIARGREEQVCLHGQIKPWPSTPAPSVGRGGSTTTNDKLDLGAVPPRSTAPITLQRWLHRRDRYIPGLHQQRCSELLQAGVAAGVAADEVEQDGEGFDVAVVVAVVAAAAAGAAYTSLGHSFRRPLTPTMFLRRCFAQRRAFLSDA